MGTLLLGTILVFSNLSIRICTGEGLEQYFVSYTISLRSRGIHPIFLTNIYIIIQQTPRNASTSTEDKL